MLQLHLGDQQFYCLLKRDLYLRFGDIFYNVTSLTGPSYGAELNRCASRHAALSTNLGHRFYANRCGLLLSNSPAGVVTAHTSTKVDWKPKVTRSSARTTWLASDIRCGSSESSKTMHCKIKAFYEFVLCNPRNVFGGVCFYVYPGYSDMNAITPLKSSTTRMFVQELVHANNKEKS